MMALLLGSALAVLALAYVLAPLLRGAGFLAPAAPSAALGAEASAIEALREIEFDQATGKLSADDYATLRAAYAPRALAELEARERAAGQAGAAGAATAMHTETPSASTAASADAAEALIARMKSRGVACPVHGPRPEGDALFCSDCGRYLAGACLRCGAAVEDAQARFCGECGAALAA